MKKLFQEKKTMYDHSADKKLTGFLTKNLYQNLNSTYYPFIYKIIKKNLANDLSNVMFGRILLYH